MLCLLIMTLLCLEEGQGNVELPLATYNQLVDQSRDIPDMPRAAPSDFAFGAARMIIEVNGGQKPTARINMDVALELFDDQWVLIPLLPSGTALEKVQVNGKDVQLVQQGGVLGWATNQKGRYRLSLGYRVDPQLFEQGHTLGVPVVSASSIGLTGSIDIPGLRLSVLPATGLEFSTKNDSATVFHATIPATSSIHLAWQHPVEATFAISRASYSGRLVQQSVIWDATFDVDVMRDEWTPIPLLWTDVTLRDVSVNGKPVGVDVEDERYQVRLLTRGQHKVRVSFEVSMLEGNAAPVLAMRLPHVPISRMELSLPGKKLVSLQPASHVRLTHGDDHTKAIAFVPPCDALSLSWTEAVPQSVTQEVRLNANLYHTVQAEEGVLLHHAFIAVDITRGETSQLAFRVPNSVQVNDIRAEGDLVSEWQPQKDDLGKRVQVYLHRKVKGKVMIRVSYELATTGTTNRHDIPFIQMEGAHRQRGMVALLASRDFALKPLEVERVTPVGENQLPAMVRQSVDLTIAHTYKYGDETPKLVVQNVIPERKVGQFDAEINTLFSLSDVSLRASASVLIHVKSGSVVALRMALPPQVNLLSLTGPSLRSYVVVDDKSAIDIQFTQEMEGQFKIDLVYERIASEGRDEIDVPILKIEEAEVALGRIAIEALSVLEIQPLDTGNCQNLDLNDVPSQLMLRTTNPILLAFSYVQSERPLGLRLQVIRHRAIDVQAATIDRAAYHTLLTRDGLQITTVAFNVRNSRQQFLRLQLPAESEVWSLFVAGKPEKPALIAAEHGNGQHILIKIINAMQGFDVSLVYATQGRPLSSFGKIKVTLPQPDMVVTATQWDLYVPKGYAYDAPTTNMNLVSGHDDRKQERQDREELAHRLAATPLRVEVPRVGEHLVFEKLYANRSETQPYVTMTYMSAVGQNSLVLWSWVASILFWLGLFLRLRRKLHRAWMVVALATLMLMPMLYLGQGVGIWSITGLVALACVGLEWLRHRLRHPIQSPPPPVPQ